MDDKVNTLRSIPALSVLADVSLSLRRRAIKVNDTEKARLSRRLQHLERNVKTDQFRRSQVIGRVNKRLLERRALYKVLQEVRTSLILDC